MKFSRKSPIQARSTQLVADVLTAAARVLARDGLARFTTTRVAEEAGVSVGSLYQYFPDKVALLYRLQVDEWARTAATLEALAARPSGGDDAEVRLRHVTRTFFASERAEAPLRAALDAMAPTWAATSEAARTRARAEALGAAFVAELVPDHPDPPFATRLLLTTLAAMGRAVGDDPALAPERTADAVVTGLLASLRHDAR